MDSRDAMWLGMCGLLERVTTAADRGAYLETCLDTLVGHLGAQRGLVLLSNPPATAAVLAARGPGRPLETAEREEISRSMVRRVEERGELLVWRADDPATGKSMEALSITGAMLAPLRAFDLEGRGPRGVLYVDFRDFRRDIDEAQVEFFRAAAALVSVVVEQTRRLDAAREDLRVARAAAGAAPGEPSLDELLWPPSQAGLRREIHAALRGDAAILLTGESGTGKTALARAIAEASGRTPVVRAVLGSSDDLNTITSELFGHERGAFSGALGKRVGLVELARGGTLILDEILNLPRHAQQLLLDFTQFGSYRPLGFTGAEPKQVRTRIIAATNGDLEAAIADGRFRLDLYYRLAQVHLRVAPLRERRDEIPMLADGFLARLDPERGVRLSLEARRLLVAPNLPWSGNVRQLEAVVRRARDRALAARHDADELLATDFEAADFGVSAMPAPATAPRPAPTTSSSEDLAARWLALQAERGRCDDAEKQLLAAALERCEGVVARAARELNLPRTTLIGRLKTLGLG
jgi:DNA-binding NtrC family response regulator